MKRNQRKITKKSILAFLLFGVMAISLFGSMLSGDMTKVQAQEEIPDNPRTDLVTWDCVWFGNYFQNEYTPHQEPDNPVDEGIYTDSNGTKFICNIKNNSKSYYKYQPIKWRVLSVDEEEAFLVADRSLDLQRYDAVFHDDQRTWETCTMRSWLNGYCDDSNKTGIDYSNNNFIDRAFTDEEQDAILTTTVENEDDTFYGEEGGNDTEDKVFLLSYDEVTNPVYGFSPIYNIGDRARQRVNTAYVVAGGTIDGRVNKDSASWWWLRSIGGVSRNQKIVYDEGDIDEYGLGFANICVAVCPALYLDLSCTDLWSYAGTVSSDGTVMEKNSVKDEEKKPDDLVNNVKINRLKITGISKKIAAGRRIALMPVLTPANATNKTLKWKSSNKKYATVNNKGVVKTKKKGIGKTVRITATTQDGSNITATYKIKIVKHAVKSIKLTAKKKTVKAGKKLKLTATVKTTGKTANKVLQWTSSNEAYAAVTKKGVVKTKKAGKGKTVKITAKATDGTGKKASIKIKIK